MREHDAAAAEAAMTGAEVANESNWNGGKMKRSESDL